ncbi:hypothetical protein M378DRAFT_1000380 [Amanita muscaria Koide BX008]|uniref:Uncharacterized protein n=1 Tax=Amanita muscaria (strain Koide BX008) TaxID=946122 RepID=A0A0C2WTA6_AMAMK|nr:hypothetical protein M378DRAFT_1000380 [Amanita muscaria Koide BX008]
MVTQALSSQIPSFDCQTLLAPIQVLPHPRLKACITALIKVLDDHDQTLAKKLMKHSVHIDGEHQKIRHWTYKPPKRHITKQSATQMPVPDHEDIQRIRAHTPTPPRLHVLCNPVANALIDPALDQMRSPQ